MGVWRRISKPETGFLDDLSEAVASLENKYPGLLVEVAGDDLWIASDYSGQHKQATHEAYSFLVTTRKAVTAWEWHRVAVRRRLLADGRHMSFKGLREPVRARALLPFLAAADVLRGNLLTFVVDKRIPSLFKDTDRVQSYDLPEIFPPGTASSTMEKSLRVGLLLALLMACLRKEGQRAIWISDQDEVLESNERRERFAELVAYMTYGLTGWTSPALLEFGTTQLDLDDCRLEDFAAIPDLAAGAMSRVTPLELAPEANSVSQDVGADTRTQAIIGWLSRRDRPLRRLILRIEVTTNGGWRILTPFIHPRRSEARKGRS